MTAARLPAEMTLPAPAGTDLFTDPAGGAPVANAPRVLHRLPDGDFQLSARVSVDFAQTYDAGVLLAWWDERHWAKLCFERSPQGRPMVVSVVNRDVSDDANGFGVDGDTLWLRISRLGRALAFHAARDGRHWEFVRYFSVSLVDPVDPVDPAAELSVGFEAQSPLGTGCTARFTEIRHLPQRLTDLRDGS